MRPSINTLRFKRGVSNIPLIALIFPILFDIFFLGLFQFGLVDFLLLLFVCTSLIRIYSCYVTLGMWTINLQSRGYFSLNQIVNPLITLDCLLTLMPLIEILSYETIAALKLILLFTTLVLLLVALLRIKTALKNPLKDSLLALRPIRVFDFFTFFDWQNRKDLQIERRGFVGYVSPLKVLTWIEKRRRLENQEIPSRVITLMGIPIGYIGLYGFGSKFAVGIYLSNRWSRGFGIGKQALTKFLELCINRGFHDLYAIIARSNPASCHLFRTCGFEELNNFSVLESLEIKSSALGNDEVVFRVYNSKLTN